MIHRVILFLLVLPTVVMADGKVFSMMAAETRVPDQQALIRWTDGEECLVVETRFVGKGNKFAWVLPLPSVPQVSEVTTGLFPTLRTLFQPKIVDQAPPYWFLAIYFGVTLLCVIGRKYLIAFLWFVIWMLPVLFTFATKTGGIDGSVSPHGAIVVHDRRIVGSYDVATVSSREPDAMLNWLKEGGYAVDSASAAVVGEYVRDGWIFAAIKLQREEDTDKPATPHPLAFTFRTDRCVYPMRLTGVNNGKCEIDLYVFGQERAEVPGFNVVRCSNTTMESAPLFMQSPGGIQGKLPIVHPQLKKLVPSNCVATRLSGTFTPEQMRQDVYVSWVPLVRQGEKYYSKSCAGIHAFNWSSVVACVGALMVLVWHRLGLIRNPTAIGLGVWVIAATVVVWSVVYVALPKVEVDSRHVSSLFDGSSGNLAYYLAHAIRREKPEDITLEWLRKNHKVAAEDDPSRDWLYMNTIDGSPMREEDSPGNYGFRITDKGPEYLWYDLYGGEHVGVLRDLK